MVSILYVIQQRTTSPYRYLFYFLHIWHFGEVTCLLVCGQGEALVVSAFSLVPVERGLWAIRKSELGREHKIFFVCKGMKLIKYPSQLVRTWIDLKFIYALEFSYIL